MTAIRRDADGILLGTSRGSVRAREVLLATDGHTGSPFTRLRRRVVPVGGYLVATAPLDPALARWLVPTGRVPRPGACRSWTPGTACATGSAERRHPADPEA